MRSPVICLSDSARRALRGATVEAGGEPLQIRIRDRFEYELKILWARMFAELDTAGFLNAKTHEPRRLVRECRQLRQAQVAYAVHFLHIQAILICLTSRG